MRERSTTMFTDEAARAANKRIRSVRKKLHEIEKLENRTACGDMLEANQLAKLATKSALAAELACLVARIPRPASFANALLYLILQHAHRDLLLGHSVCEQSEASFGRVRGIVPRRPLARGL